VLLPEAATDCKMEMFVASRSGDRLHDVRCFIWSDTHKEVMSSDCAYDYECPVSVSKCNGCCKVIDIYIYIYILIAYTVREDEK
jgi:hypothetical protein